MKQQTHEQPDNDNEPLAPLDEQEQRWTELLSQRDSDLLSDSDAFIDGVMGRLEQERGRAVLARIGQSLGGWKPLAAAAAVALAGLVGWYVLDGDATSPAGPGIADQSTPTTAPQSDPSDASPADGALADNRPRPEDVPVGQIIGEFSRSVTQPQVIVLPTEQTPTRLQKVLALFENPIEDATRFVPQRVGTDRG